MISIVFITANRCALLLDALKTVHDLPADEPYEIVVVDNGSTDGTPEKVRERFPEASLLALTENRGVAGGRNVGLREAKGDLVAFIDDDALLTTPEMLSTLRQRFAANPNLAVVAFKIINDQANAVLSHEFPMRAFAAANVDREQLVAYFVGCGFAVRREYFLEAGGFFEAMFYGLEELDLAYRLLDRGWDLLYCPTIIVRHRTPPEVRRKGGWYYNLMRSRVMLVLRNLPWWAAGPHLLLWQGGLLLHAVRHGHLGSYMRGLADGWRMAPKALRTRRPISRTTARRLSGLSGRLFY